MTNIFEETYTKIQQIKIAYSEVYMNGKSIIYKQF